MLEALDELEALRDTIGLLELLDELRLVVAVELRALLDEGELATLFLSILSSIICA